MKQQRRSTKGPARYQSGVRDSQRTARRREPNRTVSARYDHGPPLCLPPVVAGCAPVSGRVVDGACLAARERCVRACRPCGEWSPVSEPRWQRGACGGKSVPTGPRCSLLLFIYSTLTRPPQRKSTFYGDLFARSAVLSCETKRHTTYEPAALPRSPPPSVVCVRRSVWCPRVPPPSEQLN